MIVDGVYNAFKDDEGLWNECEQGRRLGFDGKTLIHPAQLAIANKVFSPSVADVAHARRVVAAMGDGTGAVMLDGKMEDDASVKQCRVMVGLAQMLADRDPDLKKAYGL